jgi:hypothetical protein
MSQALLNSSTTTKLTSVIWQDISGIGMFSDVEYPVQLRFQVGLVDVDAQL